MKTRFVLAFLLMPIALIAQSKTVTIFQTDTMRDSSGKVINIAIYVKDSLSGSVFACGFSGAELKYSEATMRDSLIARTIRVFSPSWQDAAEPPESKNKPTTVVDSTKTRLVLK